MRQKEWLFHQCAPTSAIFAAPQCLWLYSSHRFVQGAKVPSPVQGHRTLLVRGGAEGPHSSRRLCTSFCRLHHEQLTARAAHVHTVALPLFTVDPRVWDGCHAVLVALPANLQPVRVGAGSWVLYPALEQSGPTPLLQWDFVNRIGWVFGDTLSCWSQRVAEDTVISFLSSIHLSDRKMFNKWLWNE